MSVSTATREYIAVYGDKDTGTPPICFLQCTYKDSCIGVILGWEYKTTLPKCKKCWCWYGNKE